MTRTLLVGDVHGCAAALDGLVAHAKPDKIVLLGDLFTKGPDPRGVWERIQSWKPECILGNHDFKVVAIWDGPSTSKAYAARAALPDEARDWIASLPLFWRAPGVIAVHAGLHPHEGMAGTDPAMAIILRRWPHDHDRANPFWWQLWPGPERVVYGHDAMRGLQVRPRSIGLDTGCCYGQALSGWVMEADEVYQVDPRGTPIVPPRRFWADFAEPGPG
ncbi:MAG: serine/threonine protein phosphatase [Deltaproteobacteria bacterium]|nr:serine/threonine protein phosphatase [Deltaproteobacteria bacterium]